MKHKATGGDVDRDLFEIIGLTYDAVLDRSVWQALMQRIASSFDSHATLLAGFELWTGRPAIFEMHGIDRALTGPWVERSRDPSDNPWLRGALRYEPGLVVTDEMLCSERELVSSPIYNDILVTADVYRTMGASLTRAGDLIANFTLYRDRHGRAYGRDEVARFSRLVPHIQNAVELRLRLDQIESQRRAALDVLERMDLGVVLVDRSGRPVFSNGRARETLQKGDGLSLARRGGERIVLALRPEQAEFERLVGQAAEAGAGRGDGAGGAVLVTRPSGARPYQVLVAPVGSELRGPQPDAVAMVLVGDPDATPPVATEVLSKLYGLTRTEAEIAVAIARGDDLTAIAEVRGVQVNTVRVHLYRLMTKTDTRRQSDLVRLLLRGPLAALAPTPTSSAMP